MRVTAIVNPISGARSRADAAAARVDLLRRELDARGIDGDIVLTEGPGHARQLARAAVARGDDLVIAWGGDGTLNEVGREIFRTPTALGAIPAGSGNGLAAALGLPRVPGAAIARIFSGSRRVIDVGTIGDRPFFNVGGVGFDAHVAALFNRRGRRRGPWPYIAIGVVEGCRYRGLEYDVSLDEGAVTRHRALLVSFANGREFGRGAVIAPQAALDDGLLETTIVEDRPVPARFWHLRHLILGRITAAPRVHVHQVRAAVVERPGPLPFHVDGETAEAADRLHVRVLPRALTVAG